MGSGASTTKVGSCPVNWAHTNKGVGQRWVPMVRSSGVGGHRGQVPGSVCQQGNPVPGGQRYNLTLPSSSSRADQCLDQKSMGVEPTHLQGSRQALLPGKTRPEAHSPLVVLLAGTQTRLAGNAVHTAHKVLWGAVNVVDATTLRWQVAGSMSMPFQSL